MKQKLALSLAAALLSLSAIAAADEPAAAPRPLGVETGISFPSDATIRTFQADDEDGVWIQDSRRNWYYAEFFGPCRNIDFAQAIGVDTRGSSRLDKYATLLVRGDRCALSSFVTSAPPPTRKEKKAAEQAAKAAKSN
ncbi:DUF6491 family protein [Sphingopyxis sp.]|uniref:DUF6491 family protein n=1 Tax=Sphingopyxis sp. TaxID=1908224 RepID=UPI00262A29FA|nr:DUF6491 family protein [Sphingopyxis sp.]MCW0197024.1 DUF6491 family protein [Sphingopyxis sp.]